MRKTKRGAPDDLREEYDFSQLTGGVRGKYLRRYRTGTNLALLDPDVAAAFPPDESVNQALRTVLSAAAALKGARRPSNRATQQSAGAGKVSGRPAAKKRAARR